jgi:hypothetical protein
MKKTNQEIDYAEAILAMRTMLSLNNVHTCKLEIGDLLGVEVVDCSHSKKPMTKPP